MAGQNTIVIQAMKRRAEEMLADWADQTQRKPLVLRGARQTGKTWLVKHDLYSSKEALAGDIASGSTGGMGESFDQLDELISRRGIE